LGRKQESPQPEPTFASALGGHDDPTATTHRPRRFLRGPWSLLTIVIFSSKTAEVETSLNSSNQRTGLAGSCVALGLG
jgi:hypothetical protein